MYQICVDTKFFFFTFLHGSRPQILNQQDTGLSMSEKDKADPKNELKESHKPIQKTNDGDESQQQQQQMAFGLSDTVMPMRHVDSIPQDLPDIPETINTHQVKKND